MILKKAGLRKTSLVDFPGLLASTIFTWGCNLRCPYCHNPELVSGGIPDDFLEMEKVYSFLESRSRIIEGVCITGGEPLMNDNLAEVIERIRGMGLKVKLDTNGMLPERLAEVSPDYIAMDLKTLPSKYGRLSGNREFNFSAIEQSLSYLKTAGIEYEIRSVLAPGIIEPDDVPGMAELLEGVGRYRLSEFRPGVTLDRDYRKSRFTDPFPMEDALRAFSDCGISPVVSGITTPAGT